MNTHTAPDNIADFEITDLGLLKEQMLNWASRFNIFLFLDNQHYSFAPQRFECVLAVGVRQEVTSLATLNGVAGSGNWYFGHLGYHLKQTLHGLENSKPDPVGFPELYFFQPEAVVWIASGRLFISAPDPGGIWDAIHAAPTVARTQGEPVLLQPRMDRQEYLQTILQLKQHIRRGDCYEINFCQELFAEAAVIDPISVFRKLCAASPAPFAALYRWHDRYLVSASPERFLLRQGNLLTAQPMKGTARRNLADPAADAAAKTALYQSQKERSENVMVVDLVRNDLSQVCTDASVRVNELYGIYSFPQVHQMVSTITGEQRSEISFSQLLQANFPMGSMTGAPKLRVMQLIDQYEKTSRGIFSGSVGYISPDGDFDFNVVIRSIMYNSNDGYLSCQVGSGITFYSDPEAEWEECLLKAAAIRDVLGRS